MLALVSVFLFASCSLISMVVAIIGYHRGLCHAAVKLSPAFRAFLLRWGLWITAMDPAIWVCNHRLHHRYADRPGDPHSPQLFRGVWSFFLAHMRMYSETYGLLRAGDPKATALISDIPGGLNPIMKLPPLPGYRISSGNALVYLTHYLAYYLLYRLTGHWEIPAAIGLGLLGHPFHGMIVNYFGHKRGYRNFDTPDASTNHRLVALFFLGEGYQNNHHASPKRLNLAVKAGEFDPGYWVCRGLEKLSLVEC